MQTDLVTSATTPEVASLKIERPLTIYEAEGLRRQMLEHWPSGGAVCIDLSGTRECDAVGVQLLLSARRKAHAEERRLLFAAVPDGVLSAFARLGFEPAAEGVVSK
jgi:anti-anti-sigma regulatory factor